MRNRLILPCSLLLVLAAVLSVALYVDGAQPDLQSTDKVSKPVFPGPSWSDAHPTAVGLDGEQLRRIKKELRGSGAIVRYGYMTYTWGQQSKPHDMASAAKVFYPTFLLLAVQDKLLASVDDFVFPYAKCLAELNPELGYKDRNITFRHLVYQAAGYGVTDTPGAAFNYSDFQTALFIDALVLGVFGRSDAQWMHKGESQPPAADSGLWASADADLLEAKLGTVLGFEDNPTVLAFGPEDRQGRIAISLRDFARFGLLYLNKGNWNGSQVIRREDAIAAVGSPLRVTFPQSTRRPAEMCPGQRTVGIN